MKDALPGTPKPGEATVYLFPSLCYFVGFCQEGLGRRKESEQNWWPRGKTSGLQRNQVMFLVEGIELEKRGKEKAIETGFSEVRMPRVSGLSQQDHDFRKWRRKASQS